jgi:hypothetical protein
MWHGMNNIKMEVGVKPHLGTALSHRQSSFYSHLPVLWCHIMMLVMHPLRGIELGRKLAYRRQAANCSLMVCVSVSEEPKSLI